METSVVRWPVHRRIRRLGATWGSPAFDGTAGRTRRPRLGRDRCLRLLLHRGRSVDELDEHDAAALALERAHRAGHCLCSVARLDRELHRLVRRNDEAEPMDRRGGARSGEDRLQRDEQRIEHESEPKILP